MSGGVYEQWVTALRAWRSDPSTDLSGLPSLAADTFTPATYGRLLSHFQDALNHMMEAWSGRLQRSIDVAHDPHELARALVSMRPELARRLQLARHPGLPAEIAEQLWDGTVNDIRSIQSQLETKATSTTSAGSSDRGHAEKMLEVLRHNSFTALLDPSFSLGAMLNDESLAVHTPPPAPAEPLPPIPSRRRVVHDI